MNIPSQIDQHLADYFAGSITPEAMQELEAWLRLDPAHIDLLAGYGLIEQGLVVIGQESTAADILSALAEVETPAVTELTEADLTDADPSAGSGAIGFVIDQALAERRKHELVDEANRRLAAQQAEDERNRRYELRRRQAEAEPLKRVVVIPKAVVWLGLAAVIGLIATVVTLLNPPASSDTAPPPPTTETQRSQPLPVLATLIRTLDARWVNDADAWQGRLGLRQGRHQLLEGLVEIELIEGTRVVLEAPVSFELTGTNAMELTDGRLVANVPPSGYGFTVDTPTARIVDYGTEFGVEADGYRETQVHVFQGEVRAASRVEGVVIGEPVPLLTEQAAAIDVGGASIARISFSEDAFVRRVAKTVDLADLMMGGDGTTRRQDVGLHLQTGRYLYDIEGNTALIGLESTGRINPVPSNPVVAGVFVPSQDGSLAGMPDGLVLPGLPATNGYGYGAIWCGDEMPTLNIQQPVVIPTALAGHNLDGPEYQTVVMHANAGLILDLDAIRTAHPGYEVTRVSAIVGNSSSRIGVGNVSDFVSEFRLYFDGHLADHERFQRSDPDERRSARLDLDVPADARHLTLVSTDGGDGNHQDWIILADPLITLEPIEER